MRKLKTGGAGQVSLSDLQKQLVIIKNHCDCFTNLLEKCFEYPDCQQLECAVDQLAGECRVYLIMTGRALP